MASIEQLSEFDLAFRLEEEEGIDPDWLGMHLCDIMAFDPGGCFVLMANDSPIGMVTTTCYQTIGWIGWLYVAKASRGHGLGEMLMKHAVGYIQKKDPGTILLEAIPEAIPLYDRLGFTSQFNTEHFTIQPDEIETTPSENVGVRDYRNDDLDIINQFDRHLFGEDRRGILRHVAGNPCFRGHLATIDDRLIGYLFTSECRPNFQVGPLIVDPQEAAVADIANALLAAAAHGNNKPLYIRCPMVTPDRSAPLETLGAKGTGYRTTRMYMGAQYVPEPEGVLSLGCPGKG